MSTTVMPPVTIYMMNLSNSKNFTSLTLAQLVDRRDVALKMAQRNNEMPGGDPHDARHHAQVAQQYQNEIDVRTK